MDFYIRNPDKARLLIASQIADCWEYQDILNYWRALGCDLFFERQVINPFFINAQ